MFGKSSNPALKEDIFRKASFTGVGSETMTVNGTVNKISIMLVLVLLGAVYTWSKFFQAATVEEGSAAVLPWMLVGGIGGLVVGLITAFWKTKAFIFAPIYAVLQGVFLGAISAFFEAMYGGIVIQAVALTIGTLFALLAAYRSGLIKVTDNFRLGVVAATGGIAVFYLVIMVMSLFGADTTFATGSGWLSIGISLVVVVVAALNLVLDFDFIEQGAAQGAPKYMEWYAAFGLMVTLIWLYLEMLRLLAKLSSRD